MNIDDFFVLCLCFAILALGMVSKLRKRTVRKRIERNGYREFHGKVDVPCDRTERARVKEAVLTEIGLCDDGDGETILRRKGSLSGPEPGWRFDLDVLRGGPEPPAMVAGSGYVRVLVMDGLDQVVVCDHFRNLGRDFVLVRDDDRITVENPFRGCFMTRRGKMTGLIPFPERFDMMRFAAKDDDYKGGLVFGVLFSGGSMLLLAQAHVADGNADFWSYFMVSSLLGHFMFLLTGLGWPGGSGVFTRAEGLREKATVEDIGEIRRIFGERKDLADLLGDMVPEGDMYRWQASEILAIADFVMEPERNRAREKEAEALRSDVGKSGKATEFPDVGIGDIREFQMKYRGPKMPFLRYYIPFLACLAAGWTCLLVN